MDRLLRHPVPRPAFTIVELLVVIAVVILLLSLLVVGLNIATKTAQATNTKALMQAIAQGLVRFKEDMGYYPPVLSDQRHVGMIGVTQQRELREPPKLNEGNYQAQIQSWSSYTTLAEYLVGYDRDRYDGYGNSSTGEVPFSGIRHPGGSGVWGASMDEPRLDDRNPRTPQTGGPGRVFGPYVEFDAERLLGSIGVDGKVYFPGDAGYGEPDDAGRGLNAKVICDYWGNPIEFFRRNYPRGALTQSYRAGLDNDRNGRVDANDVPTLSAVVRLRPYRIAPNAATDAATADGHLDTSTTFELETGEFALFSPGPDRVTNDQYRVDKEQLNRDNIVEVGR